MLNRVHLLHPSSLRDENSIRISHFSKAHTCPEHLILCHLITLTFLYEQYDVFNSSTLFTYALPFII